MLTPQQQEEIEQEAARYENRSAACIEALRIVQRDLGWVPNESIQDIARYLNMTPDEVDAVATFYNLIFRRKVGRNVIFVCDSVSCWVMGCQQIFNQLSNRLGIQKGETTVDGRFTIIPIACLGNCEKAPVMMINKVTYSKLTFDKINEILLQLERSA